MAKRLSIDWPRTYYEALERVATLPEYAGKIAIFPLAEEGQRYRAGNFRGSEAIKLRQDADYRALDDRRNFGSTLGYQPGVRLQLEVTVPEGNIGCVLIYDNNLALAGVRARAQQMLSVPHDQPTESLTAETETLLPVSVSKLPE